MRRKSSDLGSGPPSGRLRLTVLLATVAAFLLVPAAQAFAGEHLKVNIAHVAGEGHGAVCSGPNCKEVAEPGYWGTAPYIECKGPPSTPIGPGTCETQMKEAGPGYEQVFLYAEPAPGSKLVEWTVQHGAFEQCGEEPACLPYVEPSGSGENNSEVTAVFACIVPGCEAPVNPTKLTIARTGEGTIASNPAGITCGSECEASFEKNEVVTLTASPALGYAFSSWTGCAEKPTALTCKVTMDKAKTVKATFIATPTLTVEKAGSGNGKVSASGISCDESCSKAVAAIKSGTSVTIKTTAAKGTEAAVLEGGTGNASSCSGATCTFPISETSSVKVKFVPIPTKTLTVNLTGPAAYKGKVTGKELTAKNLISTAISCGSGCTTTTEAFLSTGETELVATPALGYSFAGWSVTGGTAGTCTGTTSPCKLLTDANKVVTAEFK